MKYEVTPKGGVCSQKIKFELDGDIVKNVSFDAGCVGNLLAISALVEGLTVEELKNRVMGIKCDYPDNTSCSEQLALAVLEAYEKEQAAK